MYVRPLTDDEITAVAAAGAKNNGCKKCGGDTATGGRGGNGGQGGIGVNVGLLNGNQVAPIAVGGSNTAGGNQSAGNGGNGGNGGRARA